MKERKKKKKEEKGKVKFTLFSDHNGSLLRQQPRADGLDLRNNKSYFELTFHKRTANNNDICEEVP